jgi:hypothetical protein
VGLTPQLREPLQQVVGAALLLFHLALQRSDAVPVLGFADDQPDQDDRQ